MNQHHLVFLAKVVQFGLMANIKPCLIDNVQLTYPIVILIMLLETI